MNTQHQLILASGSPRRRELLAELGYNFEVIPSAAEEVHRVDLELTELCEINATLKTEYVASAHPAAIVLGGDTLVSLDNEPLGKPESIAEAFTVLGRLSGRVHQVCTAMCLMHGSRVETFHAVTNVAFKKMSNQSISTYLDKVNVMDKAGSYAIQERGEMIIESIEGDYSNVVGLPQELVLNKLQSFGLQPQPDRAH
jgi:septum formation protein